MLLVRNRLVRAAILAGAISALPAAAADWFVDAHVTVLTADNLPNAVTFQLDFAGSASCPANSFMSYLPQSSDQGKAVFAMLLGAKLSGRTARFYGNNAGCVVTNIHFGG
jgi:hypothetical protein